MEKVRLKAGSNLMLSVCCHLLVVPCNLVCCIELLVIFGITVTSKLFISPVMQATISM